jgi:hypothetical protein
VSGLRTGSDAAELNVLSYKTAVGPENDEQITAAAQVADRIIVAWGGSSHVKWYPQRVREVLRLIGHRELWCVRRPLVTQHPLHPQVWSPAYALVQSKFDGTRLV